MSNQWLSLAALLMALIIVVAGLRGHRIGVRRGVLMALAWVAIVLVAVFVFTQMGWR